MRAAKHNGKLTTNSAKIRKKKQFFEIVIKTLFFKRTLQSNKVPSDVNTSDNSSFELSRLIYVLEKVSFSQNIPRE